MSAEETYALRLQVEDLPRHGELKALTRALLRVARFDEDDNPVERVPVNAARVALVCAMIERGSLRAFVRTRSPADFELISTALDEAFYDPLYDCDACCEVNEASANIRFERARISHTDVEDGPLDVCELYRYLEQELKEVPVSKRFTLSLNQTVMFWIDVQCVARLKRRGLSEAPYTGDDGPRYKGLYAVLKTDIYRPSPRYHRVVTAVVREALANPTAFAGRVHASKPWMRGTKARSTWQTRVASTIMTTQDLVQE